MASSSPRPPRPLTLLVVDDERLFLRSLEHALTEAGHRALTAASAAEALALLDRHPGPLDVLLTDVCLDGEHGRAVALRARERHPAVGVLFMSATPREQLLREGRIPADGDVVEKPFLPDELTRRIAAVLAPRRGVSGGGGLPA